MSCSLEFYQSQGYVGEAESLAQGVLCNGLDISSVKVPETNPGFYRNIDHATINGNKH